MLVTCSGSSRPRTRTKTVGRKKPRSVDEIEEELEAECDPLRAPSTRRKQIPTDAKKVPNRQKTASTMPDAMYVERRKENPYVVERMHLIPSIRGNDPRFHTVFKPNDLESC